jgi:hypothetical protein
MYQVYLCDRCGRSVDSRSIPEWDGGLAPGWCEVLVTAVLGVVPVGEVDDATELYPEPDMWLLCDACSPAAVADLRAYVHRVRPPAN